MTPWQFGLCLKAYQEKKEAEHDSNVWFMWHSEAIARIKKLPPMNDFLSGKKPVKVIDENAIIARLKAYQKRVENGER